MDSPSRAVQTLLDKAVLCAKQAEEHRNQTIVHRDGYLWNAKLAGESLNAAIDQAKKEAGKSRNVAGPIRDEFCRQAQVEKTAAYNYRLVAQFWDFLQSQQPLPDSISQCLKLISGGKGTQSGRHPNYMLWRAEQKQKQQLHELWTSDRTFEEKTDLTRAINEQYQAQVKRWAVPPRKPGTGCMADSGAFTLFIQANALAKQEPDEAKQQAIRDAYYDSPSAFEFMNQYAQWVKRNKHRLHFYANLDVIGDPERTWRNQRYLEDVHHLTPMPVIHAGTDLKWLHHYIANGYKIIGFGGLKGRIRQSQEWLAQAFDVVCDQPSRLPKIDVHGFGVSQIATLHRYPWYSVDHTTWSDLAQNGIIAVPPREDGAFVFNKQFTPVTMSKGVRNKREVVDGDEKKPKRQTYETLSDEDRSRVDDWLDLIDVYHGKKGGFDGVITDHSERREANLRYFEAVRRTFPEYPWPYTPATACFTSKL